MTRPRQPPRRTDLPTEADAAAFDRFFPMLSAAHHEMSELSKKNRTA